MFESLLFRPNFPTAPSRSFDFFTFPNDLEASNRKYYTEIQFFEYSSGSLGELAGGSLITGSIDIYQNGFKGQGIRGNSLGLMKLPIPQRINDSVSFSWGQESLVSIGSSLLQNFSYNNNLDRAASIKLNNLINAGGAVKNAAEVLSGYALNPLFFQTFQHQNFREFGFQWTLAPRTRTESATIASMITLLKRAATPSGSAGGLFLGYPAIAMIRFSPNDLNGAMKMKPCVITNISVDHTPVAGPAFFKGEAGAPVVVGIGIQVKELQLWYREDYYNRETQSQISQNVPASSGIRDDRQTPVTTGRDDRAPGTR
jgi:hypothetical protein